MKLSLACDVQSQTLLDGQVEINVHGKIYIFYPNPKGMLSRIKIICDVENQDLIVTKVQVPQSQGAVGTLRFEIDPSIHDDLVGDLQYLESNLAFLANVEKIRWEEPEYELIPGNSAERAGIDVTKFTIKRTGYSKPVQTLRRKLLLDILGCKDERESITVLLGFWRDAIDQFNQFNYIYAFASVCQGTRPQRSSRDSWHRPSDPWLSESNLRRVLVWLLSGRRLSCFGFRLNSFSLASTVLAST